MHEKFRQFLGAVGSLFLPVGENVKQDEMTIRRSHHRAQAWQSEPMISNYEAAARERLADVNLASAHVANNTNTQRRNQEMLTGDANRLVRDAARMALAGSNGG